MGFNAKVENSDLDRSDVQPDDFVKFGMIPEFTGRFPVVVHTDELTRDDLVAILINTKNSLVKQMQFYFTSDDIDLAFTDEAILAVADRALELGTGARGLKAILERVLNPYMFALSAIKEQGIQKIEITDETVKYNSAPNFKETK